MSTTLFNESWFQLSAEEKAKQIRSYYFDQELWIAFIDDDAMALEVFKDQVQDLGFQVFTTSSADDLKTFIKKNKSKILCIFSDFKMPNKNGFEVREYISQVSGEIPFIMLSGFVDKEMAMKGIEFKIHSFFEKPFNPSLFSDFLKKDGEIRLITLKDEYEMLKGFTEDASNLLEQLEEACLELETNPQNTELVSRVFGMVHTIKGSSGFFEPRDLHEFAHSFEDLLKQVQGGQKKVTPGMISVWLRALDYLKQFISEFKTGQHQDYNVAELKKMFEFIPENSIAESPGGENQPQEIVNKESKDQKISELKVSMNLLDEFMQISGEMTVIRNMINKTVRSIEKQYRGDKDVGMLSELLEEMHKINSEVQNKITDIRRVSASQLVKPLTRIVRDTARALNKEVDFMVEGEDLRLDNSIAEILTKSLVHMMRNSLDHGLESTEERKKSGKPVKGKLYLIFKTVGEEVKVTIRDDGKGINTDKIREKVISQGLKTPEMAKKMTDPELWAMIFESGFSTAQQTTEFSGRGVGMSMVKDSVESMKGRIEIDSVKGKGTEFHLIIPIPKSVLITNCLFVQSGQRQYGIPQEYIYRVVDGHKLSKDYFRNLEGSEYIIENGELVPLISLTSILGIPKTGAESLFVLLKYQQQLFALKVDQVLDIEDTVIKPLQAQAFKNLAFYLGGTFLGDASIGLIFDIPSMAEKIGLQGHKKVVEQNTVKTENVEKDKKKYLVFESSGKGKFALEDKYVARVEKIKKDQVQYAAGSPVVAYRQQLLDLIDLGIVMSGVETSSEQEFTTIILNLNNKMIGLVIKHVTDFISSGEKINQTLRSHPAIQGAFQHGQDILSVIEIEEIVGKSFGEKSSEELRSAA